jgi:hypothetical protein
MKLDKLIFTTKAEIFFTNLYGKFLRNNEEQFYVEYSVFNNSYSVSIVSKRNFIKSTENEFNLNTNDNCLTYQSKIDGEKVHILTKETEKEIENIPLTNDVIISCIMKNLCNIINDDYYIKYSNGETIAILYNYYRHFYIPSDEFFEYYGIIPSFRKTSDNELFMSCEIKNPECTYGLMKINDFETFDKLHRGNNISLKDFPISLKHFFKALIGI